MDIRDISPDDGAKRVSAQEARRINPSTAETGEKARDTRAPQKAADRVELSEEAQALAKQALDPGLSETRDEKVEAIRKQVETGNYQVDPQELARIMLQRLDWSQPGPPDDQPEDIT
ncbi:MAG: flagellar biosynthesis anti-sigma factor FlgM [Chloroflexota bacterium]